MSITKINAMSDNAGLNNKNKEELKKQLDKEITELKNRLEESGLSAINTINIKRFLNSLNTMRNLKPGGFPNRCSNLIRGRSKPIKK